MQTRTKYENTSFSYEVLCNSSYLVAAFKNAPINYQIEMLIVNEIANILPASKHRKNADIQIYYNVTSKISLTQAFGRQKLSKNNFLSLILGAINAFKEVDEYQLVNAGIVLDPDFIFVKTGAFEPAFVYLPIYMVDEGIKRLREFIISLILKDVIEVSNDNFVQILLSRINSDTLTITELEKLIIELKNSLTGGNRNDPPPKPLPALPPLAAEPEPIPESKPKPAKLPIIPTVIPSFSNDVKRSAKQSSTESTEGKKSTTKKVIMLGLQVLFLTSFLGIVTSGGLNSEKGSIDPSKVLGMLIIIGGINFVLYRELFINIKGEGKKEKNIQKPTAVPVLQPQQIPQPVKQGALQAMPLIRNNEMAAGSGDTVILTDNITGTAYLQFFENGIGNKIVLDKPSVLVGRFKGQVDYIIDNNAVGKIHAEFISREGNYFIKDYNSTNGTYLNGSGQRIISNVEYQINNNDRISLANCELILKC